jgi:hypothetical protein
MSSAVSASSSNVQPQPLQAPQVPTFLQTASKATKFVAAIGFAIVGIASMAIGITMTPFVPEIGLGAIAFSTFMFGIAGYLLFDGVTTGSRNIDVVN